MKPKKILEFKTISPFYELCRDGKKPFDIRLVDNKDSRYKGLYQIRNMLKPCAEFQWAIRFINPSTNESFIRWLIDWNYLTNHEHLCIEPSWAIMYLGGIVNPTPNE